MLTPEKIAQMDAISGFKTPTTSPGSSRADEIRSIAQNSIRMSEAPVVTAGKETVNDFKNLGQDTLKTFQDIPKRAVEGAKDADGKIDPLKAIVAAPAAAGEAIGHTVGNVAKGVGSLFALPINTVIEGYSRDNPDKVEAIKNSKVVTDLQSAFSRENLHPKVAEFVDHLEKEAQKNPEVARSVKDFVETVMLGGGAAAEKKIVNEGEKIVSKIPALPSASIAEKAPVAFEQAIEDSKKILNPSQKYNPTEVEKLRQRGEIKTKGKGIFKKEVANPNTNPTHETLASLVEEGKISSKNLPNENIKIIKQEARINDSNIDEIVNRPELNKPFTKSTINKVFKTIENSAKKDLIFVSDSTEEKIYKAVMDVAKEEVNKNSLNSSGLRKSIKAFNARMEEILGKDIYTGSSESVGNARLQAAKDVRKNLSNFLADNLESPEIKINKNIANKKIVNKLPSKSEYELGRMKGANVYRSQLRREAQLLNAADEIAYRSRGTLNKTEMKKWLDAHPKTKKAIGFGSAAVGGKIGLDLITGN